MQTSRNLPIQSPFQMRQSRSFRVFKKKSAVKVYTQAEKFGCSQSRQNLLEVAFSNSMRIDWSKKAVISESQNAFTSQMMDNSKYSLKKYPLSSLKKMNTSSEKETLAKTFICLLKDRQRHKKLSNFSSKIPTRFTEALAKVKLEEGQKSLISFLMQISKGSTTTLLRKREWIWEFWHQ